MTRQRDKRFENVFVVENIIILSLIFILDYSNITAIKENNFILLLCFHPYDCTACYFRE